MKPELLTLKVVFSYYENGQVYQRQYFDAQNRLHNPYGPALFTWYEDGELCSEIHCMNGEIHNEKGVAYRWWDANGNRIEYYYIRGERLLKEEFERRVNKAQCEGRIVEIDGVKYRLEPVKGN